MVLYRYLLRNHLSFSVVKCTEKHENRPRAARNDNNERWNPELTKSLATDRHGRTSER